MTDITPITPTHICASCKATISTLNIYEGHTDSCMQPKVRWRRIERMTAEHRVVIDMMSGLLKESVRNCELMSKVLEESCKQIAMLTEMITTLERKV